ncbi:TIGR02679 family protein [Collimonas antrihumi]|uniref:TIGR02679 family protein n=1 Tax=Collimonas antrihumi TaxID=1940615 RepID=UPI001B8C91BB|nr:TIGR02679 family protein [Collimonas antrihumi]
MTTDNRLQRLLGGEPLAALRRRLRQRYERAATEAPLQVFRIERLTAVEHAALAALQGKSSRFAASMQIDIAAIDAVLRQAGVADSLRAALEQLDGCIVYRAVEREALQTQWQQLRDTCVHPALASLLQMPSNLGLLKRLAGRNHATAAHFLEGAQAVLNRLPARGLTRAQLAAQELGDAHALDNGCAVATLVLAVLRSTLNREPSPDPEDAEFEEASDRELWASAGVLVNELARPALVLNLPGVATLGEPAYLSLRNLLRSPPEFAVQGQTVFVCENPNLIAIAADHLGENCAPMVCTDGMPAAAQRTLLTQLAQAGATLRYHGDFDWPGIRIGNHVMREHGTQPWRFGAADYLAALGIAPRPGRPLQGAEDEPSWDAMLALAMRTEQQAIDEELVAELLIQDLTQQSE